MGTARQVIASARLLQWGAGVGCLLLMLVSSIAPQIVVERRLGHQHDMTLVASTFYASRPYASTVLTQISCALFLVVHMLGSLRSTNVVLPGTWRAIVHEVKNRDYKALQATLGRGLVLGHLGFLYRYLWALGVEFLSVATALSVFTAFFPLTIIYSTAIDPRGKCRVSLLTLVAFVCAVLLPISEAPGSVNAPQSKSGWKAVIGIVLVLGGAACLSAFLLLSRAKPQAGDLFFVTGLQGLLVLVFQLPGIIASLVVLRAYPALPSWGVPSVVVLGIELCLGSAFFFLGLNGALRFIAAPSVAVTILAIHPLAMLLDGLLGWPSRGSRAIGTIHEVFGWRRLLLLCIVLLVGVLTVLTDLRRTRKPKLGDAETEKQRTLDTEA